MSGVASVMEASRLSIVLETTSKDLLGYLERRLERHEDAADLLAEVLLIAWRRRLVCPGDDEQARMWLFRIAANVLSNHRRSTQRRLALADRLREHLTTFQPEAPVAEPSAVTDAVRALPPEHRELVALVHWEGFSITAAAQILGIGASTARSRYAVAKAKLRDELASWAHRVG